MCGLLEQGVVQIHDGHSRIVVIVVGNDTLMEPPSPDDNLLVILLPPFTELPFNELREVLWVSPD